MAGTFFAAATKGLTYATGSHFLDPVWSLCVWAKQVLAWIVSGDWLVSVIAVVVAVAVRRVKRACYGGTKLR